MATMLANLGNTIYDVFLFVAAIAPVIGFLFFARWFLRAGKRYEERERAAARRPPV